MRFKSSSVDAKLTVNTLMGNNRGCLLPSHTSDVQLASDFSDFFTTKVSTFRDSLCPEDTLGLVTPLDGDVQVTLDSFVPTTNEEIVGIIESSPDKSCNLDPIPTWLLKSCTSELAPIIVAIVNRSFETSHVPVELKRVHIRPHLKKPSLDPVRTWLAQNMLKLNDDKTEVILFTSKHGLKSLPNIAVSVGGQQQQLQSSSVRDLWVIYDQHLRMTQHVNSVSRTGYCHLRNIGRIRRYLSHDSTKTLVHALVTSRLDYCNSLLHGLPVNRLAKMQRLQNACARMIIRTSRRSHITSVLKELHWLPVHRRIQYKIMSQTFRAIHHQAPDYLSDLLSIYRPTRSLRSESIIILTVPRIRTATYGDRTFTKPAATL